MREGDYIYYRNKFGSHEPGVILKTGRNRVKVKTDGSGDTNPGVKWVSISNVELQK